MKYIGTVGRMWADNTYSSFTDSLVDLMTVSQQKLCGEGELIKYNKATISWHAGGRNQLVAEMEGDWLLQLDTDHVFAPDLLIRLLHLQQKYDMPVISAVYQYKFAPHGPVAGMWGEGKQLAPIVGWDPATEILQVGAVGGGALLVRREVYKRIASEMGQDPFDIIEGLSEDYSFCWRCKQLGIPVGLAVNVESHHIIRSVLHLSDYDMKGQPAQAVTAIGGSLGK